MAFLDNVLESLGKLSCPFQVEKFGENGFLAKALESFGENGLFGQGLAMFGGKWPFWPGSLELCKWTLWPGSWKVC